MRPNEGAAWEDGWLNRIASYTRRRKQQENSINQNKQGGGESNSNRLFFSERQKQTVAIKQDFLRTAQTAERNEQTAIDGQKKLQLKKTF